MIYTLLLQEYFKMIREITSVLWAFVKGYLIVGFVQEYDHTNIFNKNIWSQFFQDMIDTTDNCPNSHFNHFMCLPIEN